MITPKPMRLEKISPRSLHLSHEIGRAPLSNLYGPNGDVTLTARLRPHEMHGCGRRKTSTMSAFVEISDEPIGAVEMSKSDDRDVAVYALGIVRNGVITGEGPSTRGRVHFSRALDARDAAWRARILTATAVADEPVSRAEAEALFEINAAATERSDNGQFDDLFAKAIVHHAASASGLPVPSRTVALARDTAIESWAPAGAAGLDIEVLEWIASQMRGKLRSNRTVTNLVAAVMGAAIPSLAQLPNLFM
jgi:hypothetical protein